ncbi:hypothetical protein CF642_38460, partial [Burkholderia pseudomallei]
YARCFLSCTRHLVALDTAFGRPRLMCIRDRYGVVLGSSESAFPHTRRVERNARGVPFVRHAGA